jgi:hypothetical protein
MHVLVLSNAGMPPIRTDGDPGIHGADVLGKQAAGVNTPNFAAVAAATTGFAIELQRGKGLILRSARLSIIFAAGCCCAVTRFIGKTFSCEVPIPIVHINVAVIEVCMAMISFS